jgi:hypothetical protein
MRNYSVLCSLLAASFYLFFTPVFALRCGTQLVNIGDTQSRVLQLCGKPTAKIKNKTKQQLSSQKHPELHGYKLRSIATQGNQQTTWTYNFGPHEFLYVLTFERGKLVAMRTDGYGR